jgi:hypothetical protein
MISAHRVQSNKHPMTGRRLLIASVPFSGAGNKKIGKTPCKERAEMSVKVQFEAL